MARSHQAVAMSANEEDERRMNVSVRRNFMQLLRAKNVDCEYRMRSRARVGGH